ncbi:MAG TPA: low temperature requirement protein A, partial [Solirubrobacteraceae bacterium]|nr:low temperature requirement protein A [Solirubrobacteraceae bacterium]
RYLGAGGTFRLEPPRLRTTEDPDEERHATWFELFFDLVFVAAISELAASLARDPRMATFARFAALFVVVLWIWILYTLYSNRFDTDDLIFRLTKSGAMLAIAAVAVEIPHVMSGEGGAVGFATACVVLRLLLIGLYLRSMNDVPGEGRRVSRVYIAGYGATTGVWLVSIFVPGPLRYALWGLAMAVDLVIPTRAWATLKGHAVTISHLTERFGTFFIIVLGQAVVSVVAGVAGFEFTVGSSTVAAICLVIALSMWWIYFDLADTSVVGRGVLGLVYVYSHFPLLAGVAAFGVGTKLAITQMPATGLTAAARWALAGGMAAFVISLAVIHLGAEWTSMQDRTFTGRILLAAFALTLSAVGGGLPPVVFVALLASAIVGQLLLEAFTPRVGAATVVERYGRPTAQVAGLHEVSRD